jgi:single-stranded-DNA-specific exonuclease
MISVTKKKWLENKINTNTIEKLRQDYNFSEILSRLIISRKFDPTEIYTINNELKLKNIFSNNIDFNEGVELVIKSINNRERICILGDYDVDGSAATSLFVRYFNHIKQPYFFYIPDREKDGYGATKKLFQKLILRKPKLTIMVDCGSTSNEAINFLRDNKIKSLIIDHHEINKPYPQANVIINPKKNNGYLEYDYFCATALTYFFIDLLSQKIKNNIDVSKYLIYVLLATVCDVMPLRKLNRLISQIVLKKFDINKHQIFKVLFTLNKKKNKLTINDLGYLIGPILNAGGRLGRSKFATELLSSNDLKLINEKSIKLMNLNEKRKNIEKSILDEIDFNKIEKENKNIVIYYDSNINEGLIGIIAARLKDYFNKPSIVITLSGNILKGSARSVYGYNIGLSIKKALDKEIILKGGGHNMAAGFTLKKNYLSIFKDFILKDSIKSNILLNQTFRYDAEISSMAFNKNFFDDIKKIAPFGSGNPLPIFLFRDLKIIKTNVFSNQHIFCLLKSKSGFCIQAIFFNSTNSKISEYLINYKKNLDVLGQINENFWNNKKSLQLMIKDLII